MMFTIILRILQWENMHVEILVNNLAASVGDLRGAGSVPGLGRSSGGGHGNPLQYSCLENSMDRGALQATVYRVAESDMTEVTSRARIKDTIFKNKRRHMTFFRRKCHSVSLQIPCCYCCCRFSRVRLCDPIDGSPPGSPVPGILQARTLEWVAISFSNA